MIEAIYFYIFASVLVLSSLKVVFARNPVTAVLFLIVAFFNAASLFIMLGAEFVGMMLIIIYIGAVAVLFLFSVIMLDISFKELRKKIKIRTFIISSAVGITLLAELIWLYKSWDIKTTLANAKITSPIPDPAITNNVHALGEVLYTQYIYPFQISGLILLVAMVGAITLTLRNTSKARKQNIFKQIATKRSDVVKLKKVEIGAGIE